VTDQFTIDYQNEVWLGKIHYRFSGRAPVPETSSVHWIPQTKCSLYQRQKQNHFPKHTGWIVPRY